MVYRLPRRILYNLLIFYPSQGLKPNSLSFQTGRLENKPYMIAPIQISRCPDTHLLVPCLPDPLFYCFLNSDKGMIITPMKSRTMNRIIFILFLLFTFSLSSFGYASFEIVF